MTNNQVRAIAGWEDAADGEIQLLLNACAERWHRAGSVLIDGSKPAIGAMLVVSGELQSAVETGDMAMPIDHVGPGAWLGVVSALEDAPEGLTVRAVTEVRVLVMSREHVERFRTQPSPLSMRIYRAMARTLYSANSKLIGAVAQVQRLQSERRKLTKHDMMAIGFSKLSQSAQQAAGRDPTKERAVEIVQHDGVPIAANFRAMR